MASLVLRKSAIAASRTHAAGQVLKVATVASGAKRDFHDNVFSAKNRRASTALNKAFEMDPPFQKAAGRLSDAVNPIIAQLSKEKKDESKLKSKDVPLFVPAIPHLLPVARWVRDNETWRQILIHDDETPPPVPRLSWYHPEDTFIPRGWFKDGLVGDWNYYFGPLGLEVNFGENPTPSTPKRDTAEKAQEQVEVAPLQASRELMELTNLNQLHSVVLDSHVTGGPPRRVTDMLNQGAQYKNGMHASP